MKAHNSFVGVLEVIIRGSHPRQLVIYNTNTGEWASLDDSNPQYKSIIISTDYLAVSYRQSDFVDKNKLEADVRSICEIRGLRAYWLDFACTGLTQDEKNADLYKIEIGRAHV